MGGVCYNNIVPETKSRNINVYSSTVLYSA